MNCNNLNTWNEELKNKKTKLNKNKTKDMVLEDEKLNIEIEGMKIERT